MNCRNITLCMIAAGCVFLMIHSSCSSTNNWLRNNRAVSVCNSIFNVYASRHVSPYVYERFTDDDQFYSLQFISPDSIEISYSAIIDGRDSLLFASEYAVVSIGLKQIIIASGKTTTVTSGLSDNFEGLHSIDLNQGDTLYYATLPTRIRVKEIWLKVQIYS